ncbi:hypothetical protein EBR57_03565 [bacterium]|nr:hypothetical protein [bacterium]
MSSKVNVFYLPPRWASAVRSAVEMDTVYQFSLIIEHVKSPMSTIETLIALSNADNSLFTFDFGKAANLSIPILGDLLPIIETQERMVIQAIQEKFGKNTEAYWNAMTATVRRLVLDDYDTAVMPTEKIYSWIRNAAIIPVSMSNRCPKIGLRFTHSELKPIMELVGSIANLSVELIAWGGVIPPIPHFDDLLNGGRIHRLSVARAPSVDQTWLTQVMAVGLPKIDLGRHNLAWTRFHELSPRFLTIELDLSGASSIPRDWLNTVFDSRLRKLNLSITSLNRYVIPEWVTGPRSLRWINLSGASGIDRRFAIQLINRGVMSIDLSSQNFETDLLGPSHPSVQLASALPHGQRINLERCYNSQWLTDQLNQRDFAVS